MFRDPVNFESFSEISARIAQRPKELELAKHYAMDYEIAVNIISDKGELVMNDKIADYFLKAAAFLNFDDSDTSRKNAAIFRNLAGEYKIQHSKGMEIPVRMDFKDTQIIYDRR